MLGVGLLSVFLPLPDDGWFLWFNYPLFVLVAGLGVSSIMFLSRQAEKKTDRTNDASVTERR